LETTQYYWILRYIFVITKISQGDPILIEEMSQYVILYC